MRARRWLMVGAAGALTVGATFVAPSGVEAVSTPAPHAAVFMNGAYVDVGDEAANVVTTLEDGGVVVSTFTGITAPDFTTALTGADVLVIPELEINDDGVAPAAVTNDSGGELAADMGPASRAVVKDWVDAGGRIIVFGSDTPWVDIDAIFGTNYEGDQYNDVCFTAVEQTPEGAVPNGGAELAQAAETPCTKQPVAATTEFAESPDTLFYNDDTSSTPVNLPGNVRTIYTWTGGEAAVTSIPQGHGAIVFLAWDWFHAYANAAPGGPLSSATPADGVDTGWFTVLLAATDATIAVGDASVAEGVTAPFTITLPNGPVSQDVVVTYDTANGTAVAGTDFVETTGTAVIPAGQTSVVVDVPTIVRPGAQGSRAFTLDVDAPYWAQVADGTGVGTITDVPDPTTTTTTVKTTTAAAAVVATPKFAG